MSAAVAASQRRAIAAWLADSLNRPADARAQWADGHLAVLALGRRFSAVRLSDELVYAVAAGTDPGIASEVLSALDGPVIHDPRNGRFYALVPASPPGPSLGPHAAYLGLGHYIGVPRVGDDEQTETWSSYWVVPMRTPGDLCNPIPVMGLVNAGTAILDGRIEL
ncbi:hypothetical protein ACFYM2_20960 [Streptomyces sp. NPDC006711]|uniref:hypothetical protein n=1 Tax=Streptomyces sp. NPDC006711 TaxID=3364762 RepID=UPI00367A9F1F